MKMGHIKQGKSRWTVEIKKHRRQKIYEICTKKSEALRLKNENETVIPNKYLDVSEKSRTSLKVILQRYLREILKKKRKYGRNLNTMSPLFGGAFFLNKKYFTGS